MNWQGRYRPIDEDRLPTLHAQTFKERRSPRRAADDADSCRSMVLEVRTADCSATFEDARSSSATCEGTHSGSDGGSSPGPAAARTSAARKMAYKWLSITRERKKTVTPVEEFAKTDTQRQAIVSCKESMSLQLPMPIVWQVREEALAVLQNVAKVYQKKFGGTHRLTADAKTRMAKIKSELGLD